MNHKEMLLAAPPGQIDDTMREMVREWPEPTPALTVLKTVDMAVHGSLCSDFVVSYMNIILKEAIERDGTTYEALVAQADWRH